jgi:putative inorganic carbon (HCO3(-)) transporter
MIEAGKPGNGALTVNAGFYARATVFLFLLFMVVGAVLMIVESYTAAVLCLLVPVVVLAASSPKSSAYLYIFCIFITWRLLAQPSILLIDVAFLIMAAAFLIDFLLRTGTALGLPSISKYYLAFIMALIFTAIFSYEYRNAVTPILRAIVQLLLIIVIYNAVSAKEVLRLVRFYFYVAVAHSLYNIITFIMLGGGYRIFGYARVYFDDLAMLAAPIGIAYFIWSQSRKESFVFGIGSMLIFFGLVATESRGPLITFGWVSLVMVLLSAVRAYKTAQTYAVKRLKVLVLGAVLAGLLLVGFSDIFAKVAERFQKLTETTSGTVWLRMSLWRTSLAAFLENPLTGVGPGNFRYVLSFFPFLKFDPAIVYLGRVSAHSLFLHYLAETGIIGTMAMLALFFKYLATSIRLAVRPRTVIPWSVSMGLLGVALTIFGAIFYMDGWMWGQNAYAAPFFIAVTAKIIGRVSYEGQTVNPG